MQRWQSKPSSNATRTMALLIGLIEHHIYHFAPFYIRAFSNEPDMQIQIRLHNKQGVIGMTCELVPIDTGLN